MKRVAIILDKNLKTGLIGNASAILMGAVARCHPELYPSDNILDRDNQRHAGIRYNTILLKTSQVQLLRLAEKIPCEYPQVTQILFSQIGQNLNNAFEEYKTQINKRNTTETKPVGLFSSERMQKSEC